MTTSAARLTGFAVPFLILSYFHTAQGLSLSHSNSTLRAGSSSCDPSFSNLGHGTKGFNVCFLEKTGNLVTTSLSNFGNTVWTIQNALQAGTCICNQACTPSQIVCKDSEKFKTLLGFFGIFNYNVLTELSQFVYALENYQAFCHCPKLIAPGADPCEYEGTPQKCPYPE